MAEQARQVGYVAASRYTTPVTAQLAETLADLTVGDLSRTHFASGGSEAVETAIKIAKQVQALRGFTKRYKVIARRGSYHGATYGAMSVTSTSSEKYFGPFVPGVSFVPSPNHYRNDFGLEGEAGDAMCAAAIEQEIITQGPETVAAVIGEPISGSSGVHIPSQVYWRAVRDICDKYGVLLIMDEVVTGFGRTGKMFGAEHFGVVPDMATMAKGLSSGYAPIGAVIVRESVFEDFKAPHASLNHLITFGGNPVSAAAATKNLEILVDENLVERSAEAGRYLLDLLERLREHPTVGDVRGAQTNPKPIPSHVKSRGGSASTDEVVVISSRLPVSETSIASRPVDLAPYRSIARPPGNITTSSAKNRTVASSPTTATLVP